MTLKEEAYNKIEKLVKRFDEQKEFYKKADYNETQTRRDFIDPFWKALGWDIDNENGYAESYREVIHEDRVKVGGATKAPDYSFRLVGGKRLFFLEAKKPSVFIKDEIQPAYQVRRYGWSAKMPISVITDFEEFAIYDCTTKPKETDKASNGRIKYLTYSDYLKEFDFIWETFSKEYVLKGSFDKYIASDKNKKGTTTVDKEFLQSLDKWRVELALNIALRNKDIDEDELNFVVQHTIDRIIFLRIAEDRSAEPYGELQNSTKAGDYYQNLLRNFHTADQKYNSGLFDFKKDKISDRISIDNKVIKSIISELYYPVCPYEFSVLSVEILGSAYEQFLGKQITLSKSGKATIEEKPEVRKAGGVYYTPQYIVEYIVKNTIGKLIEGKTPKEVSKLKIADPACGSGSFLIGAYQFLLNWHKDFYTQNGKVSKGNKDNPLTPTGELTTAEKKRILLNNIYGVDLDSNAVEVTKLSLLLKCMEGETKETIEAQTKLFHDRILPTLDNNIKSGNSLIDLDYYDNELDFGEERKVKPFSWQKAFPEAFQQGGFGCVIGNPPYVTIGGKEDTLFEKKEVNYLFSKFISNQYKPNLYAFFYEKGFSILKEDGLISFIVPRTFIDNVYYKTLREFFVENSKIVSLMKLNYEVFEDATTGGTSICIFQKAKLKNTQTKAFEINNQNELLEQTAISLNQKNVLVGENKAFSFANPVRQNLATKIFSKGQRLDYFCSVNNGVNTGNAANVLLSEKPLNKKYRKILEGKDINKYITNWKGLWINYDITLKSKISLKDLKTKQNKIDFALRDERIFNSEKLIIRQTADRIIATYDNEKFISRHSTHVILNDYQPISIKYLLGLLNSNLMNFYYNFLIPEKGKAFAEVKAINVKQLPIKEIKTKDEIQKQNEIAKLVDLLLQLNKEKQEAKLENKIEQLQNRIDYAEQKINEIVYELYELSGEEIKIVESK
ncbi:MAG: N-6 DNA methylase [Bacteroidetes bacterium]|nr:N-6 DNA methylase [Bacteroidota bacterium]